MRAKGDEKERGRRESKRDKERQIERKEKVEAPEERQREKKKIMELQCLTDDGKCF